MIPTRAGHRLSALRSFSLSLRDRGLLAVLFGSVVLHIIFTLLPYRSDLLREWVGNLWFSLPFFTSALLAFRAAGRRPAQRTSWLWFAWGQIGWGIGQGIYTYLQMVQHVSPYPSLADAFFLTLIPCFITGLLLLNRSSVGRGQWPILTLDTTIIILALAGAYWEVAVAQTITGNKGSILALTVGLAYPIADLLLIALLIVLCVWRPRQFAGIETLTLTAGLALLLFADAGYQIKTAAETYQVGYTLDTFWTMSAALFGLAAALTGAPKSSSENSSVALTESWIHSASFIQLTLPYLALLLVLGQAVSHYLRPDLESRGVILTAFLVVVLSSIRQFITQYESRRLHHDLDRQSKHDPLTGLVNRSFLAQLLKQALAHNSPQHRIAVLFVDLDRFKLVNDTYGHEVGDALLHEVAFRLRSTVRSNDIVGRQGGDEFVLILTGIDQTSTVDSIGFGLLQTLNRPFFIAGELLSISASIGVAMCCSEGSDGTDALKNADTAMYEAKRLGRNKVQYYNLKIQEHMDEVHRIAFQMRGAIERGEMSVHYQPLVTMSSKHTTTAEALIRWNSPVLGVVSPATFIPIAEERGLITSVGDWVLETAAQQVSQWRRSGYPDFAISVNVSPLQFEQEDFTAKVASVLQRHGISGNSLMIELTEGTLLKDTGSSNDKLVYLRSLEVRVALDDFGTGYSSLAYLRSLNVDVVKIDCSFIWAIEVDGLTFVEAIVRIAHHLGLQIVAEGIETMEQCSAIETLLCDYGQGYLFSRPLPADEFIVFLEQESTSAALPS